MIRSGRGSRFFLDISRAAFIPKKVMDVVDMHLHRAVKLMPAQDILDLAINGGDKVMDTDDANDMMLAEAENKLKELTSTVTQLKQHSVDSAKTIQTLNEELNIARK